MSNHLSEDQFAKCIAGRPDGVERQHIAECPECSAELERFGNTLSLFRSAIRDRIEDRMAPPWPAVLPFPVRPAETRMPIWRWAAVAVVVVLFVVLPFFISKPVPQEKSEQVSVEPDADALMNAVNLRLSRTLPAPMEPVMALLPSNESITQSGGVQ